MLLLSLGAQPPSNSFIRAEQVALERRFPLDLVRCAGCSLVQLGHTVAPEFMFDDYVYQSSSSRALVEHYATLATQLARRAQCVAGDVVVDIGCNDGILLQAYAPDLRRIGVEPSSVADLARAKGLEVIGEFFSPAVASGIVAGYGPAHIVTATNVFAHVDDVHGFLEGVGTLLRKDGIFVIEAPYLLDMIDGNLFDLIYHEHLAYVALTPLAPLLVAHGLAIIDVERVNLGASGPAVRVTIGHAGRAVAPAAAELLALEQRWGIAGSDRFTAFARRVATLRLSILEHLQVLRDRGEMVPGYGAPAKGNTLLNYLGLTSSEIPYVADASPAKQGLLTPGSHIPVVTDSELLARAPRYALLLAWNYLDFFLTRSEFAKRGGRFLVPLPAPRIVP